MVSYSLIPDTEQRAPSTDHGHRALTAHRIRQSCQIPIAHSLMYTSENATMIRLIHAHLMCQRFKQLAQSYATCCERCLDSSSRKPPTICRKEWQPSV